MSVVAVEELSVRKSDGTPLLTDVSLSVGSGETVLLAGPSGSGKTLLGTAIAGLLGERGSLTMGGDIERTGSIGILFQNPRTQLVRERVRADVAFGLENRGVDPTVINDRIDAWADRLDATHLLDREIHALSRGETTLVALLGTLVTDPALLVLDEPLASLDARNRQLVLDAIEELQRDTALLVAEHDVTQLLELADRTVLLENGEIRATGNPQQVVGALHDVGIKLPFATAVALRSGDPPESVPLSGG